MLRPGPDQDERQPCARRARAAAGEQARPRRAPDPRALRGLDVRFPRNNRSTPGTASRRASRIAVLGPRIADSKDTPARHGWPRQQAAAKPRRGAREDRPLAAWIAAYGRRNGITPPRAHCTRREKTASALAFAIARLPDLVADRPRRRRRPGLRPRRRARPASDTALGTVQQPFRTVGRLAASLQPGQTGCLRGGTYRGDVNVTRGGTAGCAGAPAELSRRARRDRRPAGGLRPGVEIAGLRLVGGTSATGAPSPWSLAGDVADRGQRDHERAHGRLPHDRHRRPPGEPASIVRGNRDPRLRPAARDEPRQRDQRRVRHRDPDRRATGSTTTPTAACSCSPTRTARGSASNVIDGNGEGVMVAGDDSATSDDNVIERNLITNSAIRDNVESSWAPAPTGTDNLVRENCFSGGVRDDGDGGIADLRAGFDRGPRTCRRPAVRRTARPRTSACGRRARAACSSASEPAVTCTKVASTTGSDSAAGTAAQPVPHRRPAGRLAAAGQTGCLRAGTYEEQRAHRPRRPRRRAGDAHELSGRARDRGRAASSSPTTRTS